MTDNLDLARRAVACKHWRWMPGMLEEGFYRTRYTEDGFPEYQTIDVGSTGTAETVTFDAPVRSSLPDLTDPATIGCLLALVREAWGDLGLSAVGGWNGSEWVWRVNGGKHHGSTFRMLVQDPVHRSEAAALVAALEAAP